MSYRKLDRLGRIRLLLDEGLITVDPEAGKVLRGPNDAYAPGLPLPIHMSRGYWSIKVPYAGMIVNLPVHRVVAVAVYGVDACRGREIAHLNHDRLDNRACNLKPMIPKEHRAHDLRTDPTLHERMYGFRKKEWSPCQVCGEEGASRRERRGGERPIRRSAKAFGVDKIVCSRCYQKLRREHKK